MALATPIVLYPVRFAATSYVLRVTSGATTENLTFPATGSLTTTRNYYVSGDSQVDSDGSVGGVGDLVSLLELCLDSNTGGLGYTVTVSDKSRNVITVAATGTFSILWAHGSTTLSPLVFGFAASNTASATSAVAPNQSQGVWAPQQLWTADTRDQQELVGATTESISGLMRSSRLATPKKVRDLEWELLLKDRILDEYTPATEPYGSAEYGWVNSWSYGRPLRVYDDASSRTSASYKLYRMRQASRMPYARSERDGSRIRWAVDLPLRRAD